jgi:hypothetical protein
VKRIIMGLDRRTRYATRPAPPVRKTYNSLELHAASVLLSFIQMRKLLLAYGTYLAPNSTSESSAVTLTLAIAKAVSLVVAKAVVRYATSIGRTMTQVEEVGEHKLSVQRLNGDAKLKNATLTLI